MGALKPHVQELYSDNLCHAIFNNKKQFHTFTVLYEEGCTVIGFFNDVKIIFGESK